MRLLFAASALEPPETAISLEIRKDQLSPSTNDDELSTEICRCLRKDVIEKFKVVHYREKDFVAGDDFATIEKVATKNGLKSLSKDQKRQQNVLLEFLNSERKQTFNLKLLASVFEPVLRSNNSSGVATESSMLFPEIFKLMDFHFTFYAKLLIGVSPEYVIQDFGLVFIEMFESLDYRSKFSEYYRWISCKTFKAEKVRKLEEDNRSLLKKRGLQDLLASEFQRATKYKLLLESVLNCALKTGGAEKAMIEKALTKVINLVEGIDKDKGLQDYRIFIAKVDRNEISRESTSELNISRNNLSFEPSIKEMKAIKLQESEPLKYGCYFVLINYVKSKTDSIQNSGHLFKKYVILLFPKYLIFIESDTSTDKMTWKTYLDKEKRFKSVISLCDILHVTSDPTKPLKDEQTDLVKNQSMNFTLLCHSCQVIVFVTSQGEKSKWTNLVKDLRDMNKQKLKQSTHPLNNTEELGPDLTRPRSMIVTNSDQQTLKNLRNEQQANEYQSKCTEDTKSLAGEKQYLGQGFPTKGKINKSRMSVSTSDISTVGLLKDSETERLPYETERPRDLKENSTVKRSESALPVSTEDIELELSPNDGKPLGSIEQIFQNDVKADSECEIIAAPFSCIENNDPKNVSVNEGQVSNLGFSNESGNSDDGSTLEDNEEQLQKSPGPLKHSSPYYIASSRFYTENMHLENLKEKSVDIESGDDYMDQVDNESTTRRVENDCGEENESKLLENFTSFEEIPVQAELLLEGLNEDVKDKFKVVHYLDERFFFNDDNVTIDKFMTQQCLANLSQKQRKQQNILLEFLNSERKHTFDLKSLCDVFDSILKPDNGHSSKLIPETKKLVEFHFMFYIKLLGCFTPDYVIQDAGPVFIDMFENADYRSKFIMYYTWVSWISVDTEVVQKFETDRKSKYNEQSFQDLINLEFQRVEKYECFVKDILECWAGCSNEESNSLLRIVEVVANEIEFLKKFKLKLDYRLLISNLDSAEVNEEPVVETGNLNKKSSMVTLADKKAIDLDSAEPLLYGVYFVLVKFFNSVSDYKGLNPGGTRSPELKKFLIILLPKCLVLVESHPETNKLWWRPYVDEAETVSSVVPIQNILQVTSNFSVSLDDCQMQYVENGLSNFTCVCTSMQLIVFVSTLEEKTKWVNLIGESLPMTDEKRARISHLKSQVIGILKESLELARSVFDPANSRESEKLSQAHQFVFDEPLFCLVDKENWIKQFPSPLVSLPDQSGTSDALETKDLSSCMKDKMRIMDAKGANEKDAKRTLSHETSQKDNDGSNFETVCLQEINHESLTRNEVHLQLPSGREIAEDIEQEINMLSSLIGESCDVVNVGFDQNCESSLTEGLRSITSTLLNSISATSGSLSNQSEDIIGSYLKHDGLDEEIIEVENAENKIDGNLQDRGACPENDSGFITYEKLPETEQLMKKKEVTDGKENWEGGRLEPGTPESNDDSNASSGSKGNITVDATDVGHGDKNLTKESCEMLISPCLNVHAGLNVIDVEEAEKDDVGGSDDGRELLGEDRRQIRISHVATLVEIDSSEESENTSEDEESCGKLSTELANETKEDRETFSDNESNA